MQKVERLVALGKFTLCHTLAGVGVLWFCRSRETNLDLANCRLQMEIYLLLLHMGEQLFVLVYF